MGLDSSRPRMASRVATVRFRGGTPSLAGPSLTWAEAQNTFTDPGVGL